MLQGYKVLASVGWENLCLAHQGFQVTSIILKPATIGTVIVRTSLMFASWMFCNASCEHGNRQGSSGDMEQSAGFNGSMTMKVDQDILI